MCWRTHCIAEYGYLHGRLAPPQQNLLDKRVVGTPDLVTLWAQS